LSQRASEFGFIIRFPRGKEEITGYQYEPWHLRYVGRTAAQEITKNKWTLEEYWQHNQTKLKK
jgi:D-alanyl-D-alanine carboxypeptidase